MQERVFGLDLMRAAAIVLVVFWHSCDAFQGFAWLPWLPPYVDGVDLFFVLSGYLVGGILLRQSARAGIAPWRLALDFLQRRWLRTLPNYYLFLGINIALVHFGVANGKLTGSTWVYAVFLQNLHRPVDLFFWESWSLVVEEWFYLVFALLLFAAAAFGAASRRAYPALVLLMIAAPLLLRLRWAQAIPSLWHLEHHVRMLAITRMDSIGWGALAAWLAAASPAAWRAIRWPALLIGLAGVLLNTVLYGEARLWYSATFFYTVNAVSMALLLPLLSCWKAKPRWGAPIVFTSLVSYALYLVHQPARAFFNRIWEGADRVEGLLLIAAYWATCFALSWLVFRFWERRFMALREGIGRRLGLGG